MATRNFAYDHPAYVTPGFIGGEIIATVSAKTARVAALTSLQLKSVNVTVVTAGGTANAIDVVRIAAGGTALTTMATVGAAIGTHVGGVTTNVLMTHANAGSIVVGDIIYAGKGSADGTGVYAVSIEYVVTPGASFTA